MAPASVNRVCTPLRAALNLAADLSEGALNREPWEIGLRAIPVGDNSRNVTIADQLTRRIVTEATRESVEFGLFVEGVAVTGARPSQLARVLVAGLKDGLLEVPSSRKGKGSKKRPHEPCTDFSVLRGATTRGAQGKSLKCFAFRQTER